MAFPFGHEQDNSEEHHDRFQDLPDDLLHLILSQLPLEQAARTSTLSSNWRQKWRSYPTLIFDDTTPKFRFDSKKMTSYEQQERRHVRRFIKYVNAVLRRRGCAGVEEFEVRFPFQAMLADHLTNWVHFAVSARTRSLAVDLRPDNLRYPKDQYIFPVEVFAGGQSALRLERLELSMMCLELPSAGFGGFPNLKALSLYHPSISAGDLQLLLSSCPSLERLQLVMNHLQDELMVERPLPRLRHLHVANCLIHKISLRAPSLDTFVYEGSMIPIDLGDATPQLKHARVLFYGLTVEYAVTALRDAMPQVEHLELAAYTSLTTLQTLVMQPPRKFMYLKHLKLSIHAHEESSDNVLSFAVFLCAAPFLESLDMTFHSDATPMEEEEIRSLPHFHYDHLKKVFVRGFLGGRGQVELVADIAANSPKLEVLSLVMDPRGKEFEGWCLGPGDAGRGLYFDDAHRIADRYIAGKIVAKGVQFDVVPSF